MIFLPALRTMLAHCAVLLTHPVSSPSDIPILELTPPHPAKNNSPHFMCLREPILQPLSFQIYAGMGGVPPSSWMGSVPSELPPLALSPLPATLMACPASVANKRLTARLSSLDATLMKKGGGGMVNHRPLGFGVQIGTPLQLWSGDPDPIRTFRRSDVSTSPSFRPVLNRTDDSPLPHLYCRCAILPSLRSGDRPFLPPWRLS